MGPGAGSDRAGCRDGFLGEDLGVRRHLGWPGADGQVHLAVLTTEIPVSSREAAQLHVDAARDRISHLVQKYPRFASLLEKYNAVWEYVGDGGSAMFKIADVSHDGRIIWD